MRVTFAGSTPRLLAIAARVHRSLATPTAAAARAPGHLHRALATAAPMAVPLTADGGIMKEVLREGSGDMPPAGANVKAHYTGTLLDGTVFDSSHKRGRPFAFTIGVGHVIKGWDVGIASMKRGEKCVLTCKPEYAYGRAGAWARGVSGCACTSLSSAAASPPRPCPPVTALALQAPAASFRPTRP